MTGDAFEEAYKVIERTENTVPLHFWVLQQIASINGQRLEILTFFYDLFYRHCVNVSKPTVARIVHFYFVYWGQTKSRCYLSPAYFVSSILCDTNAFQMQSIFNILL